VTDEYALLMALVEHAESGETAYELSVDVEHVEQTDDIYRTCCAVYVDGEQAFLIDMKELSTWLISPSRLRPFGNVYIRNRHRKDFRLEDEPMK